MNRIFVPATARQATQPGELVSWNRFLGSSKDKNSGSGYVTLLDFSVCRVLVCILYTDKKCMDSQLRVVCGTQNRL
jgi:hypothetical protein